jgi:hypothetical protein
MKEKACLRLFKQFADFLQQLTPEDVASLESGARTIEISLSKPARKAAKPKERTRADE